MVFSSGKAIKCLFACLFVATFRCRTRVDANNRNATNLVVLSNSKRLRQRNTRSFKLRRLEARAAANDAPKKLNCDIGWAITHAT